MPGAEPHRVLVPRHKIQELGGCSSKLPPLELEALLTSLQASSGKLAGAACDSDWEDCAVVSTGSERLLSTVDFGPLVGEDLFLSGRIAALNAISDIYACGGEPLFALAILVVNRNAPPEHAEAVLSGLKTTCAEEGTLLVGGHTLRGAEPMAGLCVVGRPGERILRKCGARVGDVLLLSKPLGVGMVLRAYRLSLLEHKHYAEALEVMCTSNRAAAQAALEAGVHAATDVTGFGLLGHLCELLGDQLGARLDTAALPILSGVAELEPQAFRGDVADGLLDFVRSRRPMSGFDDKRRLSAMLDPQTNGGLLVAAAPESATALLARGYYRIGEVTSTQTIEG